MNDAEKLEEVEAALDGKNYEGGLKRFGKSWGAPVCREAPRVTTPVGKRCARQCGRTIQTSDQGVLLPFSGGPNATLDEIVINNIPHLPYHLDCFLDSIGLK